MENNLGNKETMARNIRHYMSVKGVNSSEMCAILDVPASTFSFWINAKTYPRIDKIEKMANFFGISKSDLVEEPDFRRAIQSKKDAAASISRKRRGPTWSISPAENAPESDALDMDEICDGILYLASQLDQARLLEMSKKMIDLATKK